MRRKVITLYKFSELSEKAQERAIEKNSYINVDFDWWESIYEDAARIGLVIKSFNAYSIDGEFSQDCVAVVKAIYKKYGKDCDTYKTAKAYKQKARVERRLTGEKQGEDFELNDCYEGFLKALLNDYKSMLDKKYEYLCSSEAIKETLEANDYEFTEEGEIA